MKNKIFFYKFMQMSLLFTVVMVISSCSKYSHIPHKHLSNQVDLYDETNKPCKSEGLDCKYKASNDNFLTWSQCIELLSTDSNNKDCVIDEKIIENSNYMFGVVEMDDLGQLKKLDNGGNQLDVIYENLKEAAKIRPISFMMYIHGWKHDASEKSYNLKNFRSLVSEMGQLQQKDNKNVLFVGVYLGWRGQILDIPGIEHLTFGNRKKAARSVAGAASTQAILSLLDAIRDGENFRENDEEDKENFIYSKTMLIGHSFGGRFLESAIGQAYISRKTMLAEFNMKDRIETRVCKLAHKGYQILIDSNDNLESHVGVGLKDCIDQLDHLSCLIKNDNLCDMTSVLKKEKQSLSLISTVDKLITSLLSLQDNHKLQGVEKNKLSTKLLIPNKNKFKRQNENKKTLLGHIDISNKIAESVKAIFSKTENSNNDDNLCSPFTQYDEVFSNFLEQRKEKIIEKKNSMPLVNNRFIVLEKLNESEKTEEQKIEFNKLKKEKIDIEHLNTSLSYLNEQHNISEDVNWQSTRNDYERCLNINEEIKNFQNYYKLKQSTQSFSEMSEPLKNILINIVRLIELDQNTWLYNVQLHFDTIDEIISYNSKFVLPNRQKECFSKPSETDIEDQKNDNKENEYCKYNYSEKLKPIITKLNLVRFTDQSNEIFYDKVNQLVFKPDQVLSFNDITKDNNERSLPFCSYDSNISLINYNMDDIQKQFEQYESCLSISDTLIKLLSEVISILEENFNLMVVSHDNFKYKINQKTNDANLLIQNFENKIYEINEELKQLLKDIFIAYKPPADLAILINPAQHAHETLSLQTALDKDENYKNLLTGLSLPFTPWIISMGSETDKATTRTMPVGNCYFSPMTYLKAKQSKDGEIYLKSAPNIKNLWTHTLTTNNNGNYENIKHPCNFFNVFYKSNNKSEFDKEKVAYEFRNGRNKNIGEKGGVFPMFNQGNPDKYPTPIQWSFDINDFSYELKLKQKKDVPYKEGLNSRVWVMNLPTEIVANHNDIFNEKYAHLLGVLKNITDNSFNSIKQHDTKNLKIIFDTNEKLRSKLNSLKIELKNLVSESEKIQ